MALAREAVPNGIVHASAQLEANSLAAAVEALATSLNVTDPEFSIVFSPSRAPLETLGPMLDRSIQGRVYGCTTAGELTSAGYQESSLVGIGFPSEAFTVHPFAIDDARSPGADVFASISRCSQQIRNRGAGAFALLLVDGLSLSEEQIAAHCDAALEGIPLFGGSAGDQGDFESTWILSDGTFSTGGAILLLVETGRPFHVFQMQHLRPLDVDLVITAACPEERRVDEMDGIPAADAYAEALGTTASELTPAVYEQHPLAIRIGGVDYIRSIQQIHGDGSMTFYCAIDEGLVVSVNEPEDFVARLRSGLESVLAEVDDPEVILVCECIQRRQFVEDRGLGREVAQVLSQFPIVGFHTYGEQLGGLHLNQTLTGIVIGR